jgi:hypothetical protein
MIEIFNVVCKFVITLLSYVLFKWVFLMYWPLSSRIENNDYER